MIKLLKSTIHGTQM